MAGLKFIRNLVNPDKVAPTPWLGRFRPGTVGAIAVGDLLEFTDDTNSAFMPLDSDYDMSGGDLAVSASDIGASDRTGYYPIWLITEGDVWEVELAAAGASANGTSVYYSAKNKLTISAGSHIAAKIADIRNYPVQGHLSVDGSPDAGQTIRTVSNVGVVFERSNSYASRFITA